MAVLAPVLAASSARTNSEPVSKVRRRQALGVGVNEAVEHQPDEGQGDHGLGDIGAFLVILGQASPSPQPSEGPLDHPPPRDEDEAAAGDAPDDDQRQPKQKAGEDHRQAVVDAVGEDGLQPAVERFDPLQQIPRAVRVLDVGRWTITPSSNPDVSTAMCRLRPFTFLAAS